MLRLHSGSSDLLHPDYILPLWKPHDIHEILLETDQGMLMIKGDDMHVSRLTLDKGEVDIDGKIDSLTYSEVSGSHTKNESLLSKLFR